MPLSKGSCDGACGRIDAHPRRISPVARLVKSTAQMVVVSGHFDPSPLTDRIGLWESKSGYQVAIET